jgi:undecaprenyl-diphosphatase
MRRLDAGLRALALWDRAWCLRFNHAAAIPSVCALFRAVSRLGDGVAWYLLMAALLAVDAANAAPAVLHMIAVGAVGLGAYKWLKSHTLRPRPYEVQTAIRRGAQALDRFSFPSGHTLHAVSFSIVAVAYYPALAWLVAPFALLVAASRMVLGLHYPSDVLAGAAIGAAIAAASFVLL